MFYALKINGNDTHCKFLEKKQLHMKDSSFLIPEIILALLIISATRYHTQPKYRTLLSMVYCFHLDGSSINETTVFAYIFKLIVVSGAARVAGLKAVRARQSLKHLFNQYGTPLHIPDVNP